MTLGGEVFNRIRTVLLTALLMGLSGNGLRANNIKVVSPRIADHKDDGTACVQFDLLWEHSWKDNMRANWDAAWVFIKAYHGDIGEWNHLYIDTDPAAHTYASANVPMLMAFPVEKIMGMSRCPGFFIYRRDGGAGPNEIKGIKTKFNYADHGYAPTDSIIVSVFAIEMVYIPKSTFIAGDGVSTNTLRKIDNDLSVGAGQQVWDMGIVKGETGLTFKGEPIPDVYPKGFEAFYIMKHEISQHAYVDFLNTLTQEQQASRVPVKPTAADKSWAMAFGSYTNPSVYRNYIRIRTAAIADVAAIYGHSIGGTNWDRESNGGNIACNFLNWDDGLAYLDWAALRPFTELEYEKAGRGHKRVIRGEMAWGYKAGMPVAATNSFTDAGLASEVAKDPQANYLETGKAPWVMRVGAFAKDSTTRYESGGTYYGVMNMSDNLWERCVNVSTPDGRSFVPNHGDGYLSMTGTADVDGWPSAAGGGFRSFQISNRQYAELNETARHPSYGFRGARSGAGLLITDPSGVKKPDVPTTDETAPDKPEVPDEPDKPDASDKQDEAIKPEETTE